jgi:ribosomal protein L24E
MLQQTYAEGVLDLRLLRQYLYFCASKASKASISQQDRDTGRSLDPFRQYLYFCTSKASKASILQQDRDTGRSLDPLTASSSSHA